MSIATDSLLAYMQASKRLPDWLPRDGLVYFDDFSCIRPFAPTGQRYRHTDSDNGMPALSTLGGRDCLYAGTTGSWLEVDISLTASDHTFGCMVYDSLGVQNQQVMLYYDDVGGAVRLNNYSTAGTDRLFLAHRDANGDDTASVYINNGHSQGGWHMLCAWQGSEWWGLRIDGHDGVSARHTRPGGVDRLHLMHRGYGFGIRNAFFYSRVLASSEFATIYDNLMN